MNKSRNLTRAEALIKAMADPATGDGLVVEDRSDQVLLRGLMENGLPLQESSDGVFSLITHTELITEEQVRSILDDKALSQIKKIECLKIIDSTNALLLRAELPSEGCHLAIAECQLEGKGRRGNHWLTPFGSQLALSMGCRIRDLTGVQTLPLFLGMSLVEKLQGLGFHGLGLKWPNDLYLYGKKMGGILVETSKDASGWKIVIGVGLNLSQDASLEQQIDQPVAFLNSQPVSEQYGRHELVGFIVESILTARSQQEQGVDLQEGWSSMDLCHGKAVRVITDEGVLTGVGAGITRQGAFILNTEDGTGTRAFHSGEISLRLE